MWYQTSSRAFDSFRPPTHNVYVDDEAEMAAIAPESSSSDSESDAALSDQQPRDSARKKRRRKSATMDEKRVNVSGYAQGYIADCVVGVL